jgi:hypothetical protein
MGFNEEIELYAKKLRYSKTKKYSEKGIDKALTRMKEQNVAGEFQGWAWSAVVDEFINAIIRYSPLRERPYRSGKRSSK